MSNNQVIKFNDINLQNITVVPYIKKDKPTNFLLNYNGGQFVTQCCWIKNCSGGGLAPGETLGNGAKNLYYTTQEARDSFKIPLNEEDGSCVQPDGTSNSEEIKHFIQTLKNIDKHIKYSKEIHRIMNIDEDDVEKYSSIYKKDKKKKDATLNYGTVKVKLLVNFEDKKQITTALFDVDRETGVVTPYDPVNDIYKLETIIKYNCEILPIIKFVKIWKKPNGEWGVTLKLLKARIKKPISKNSNSEAEFIDDTNNMPLQKNKNTKKTTEVEVESDDDSDNTPQPPPTPQPTSNSKQSNIVNVESSDSDTEDKPIKTNKNVKTKTPVSSSVSSKQSKIAEVESSESESESESDDNTQATKLSVVNNKNKQVIVESSDSESEEIKPVKKAVVKGRNKK